MKLPAWLSGPRKYLFLSLAALLVVSLVRVFTGADDLTSSGTMSATIRVSTPILLAGLAGLWAERAGVVNIGIEGMMIVGSWLGGWAGWHWGSWAGIVVALAGGALVGLLHAVATVRFNVDHVVSGIAINILAAGSTEYLSIIAFKGQQGGGESQSPPGKKGFGSFDMPFLAGGRIGSWRSPDLLGWIEGKHKVPLLPDLAGMAKGLVSDIYLPTLLALALVPLTAWVLWRTRFGLRVRSSGESPQAGESLGVNINRLRYQALAISGSLAAFGGAFLSCVLTNTYRQGQTGGRGFIGLATTIFGNWMPFGVARGALLFGFPSALSLRSDDAVMALFVVGAVVLVALAARFAMDGRLLAMGISLLAAALAVFTYSQVDKVPQNLVTATPYVLTVIVLAGARQQLRPPAHAGLPYQPGTAH
ncbi:MAG: ABC transporter permease [Actinomycetota bacterium]